jgi:hypothetical protein
LVPLVSIKRIRDGFDNAASSWTLGPRNRNATVDSLAVLNRIESLVPVAPLKPQIPKPGTFPFSNRSAIQGLWAPHHLVRDRIPDIMRSDGDGDSFNLSPTQLAWNHGDGQDEYELKEAYLDVELAEGRLFLRLGKQTIVWGKTELFRNQDQWNPQDVGLSSLPSLEESRLAQWGVRAIYSFYDVGPLEDVRLELATLIDDFQSIDAGTCGEPYSPFLVCAGSFAFTASGMTGAGIYGAITPENPWDDISGLEIGARLEWRWRSISFALTDFWGYSDIPYLNRFGSYSRNVDPDTGRPLDALGREYNLDDAEGTYRQALLFDPQNRSLFEFSCSVSVGVAGQFIPQLADECALSVFNSSIPIADFAGIPVSVASAFTQALAGTLFGGAVLCGTAGITDPSDLLGTLLCAAGLPLTQLNIDPNDGPPPLAATPCTNGALRVILGAVCLAEVLTNAQEALLGCGAFYGTDCDIEGFDIYNAEASVLYQAFPMFEPGGPVGTRFVRGHLIQLPGSRGPGEPGYDPTLDGCVGPLSRRSDPKGICFNSTELINPQTGERFRSEMEALSFNLLELLVAFGSTNDPDGDCGLGQDPLNCDFIRGLFNLAGITRPDLRAGGNRKFGRRDFIWANGGPAVLEFQKRNVLGLAMDFAEDRTKTNWSLEATWASQDRVGDEDSETLNRKIDVYRLSISVDRPTFVNFLNANRTFLFNSQIFLQYVPGQGEIQALGTFTILTGYFRDRLLAQFTAVHEVTSATGGLIADMTWRFTSNFSATIGLAAFYGDPHNQKRALFPIAIQNNGGDFTDRSRYDGLSILRDQDEVSLRFRYTF